MDAKTLRFPRVEDKTSFVLVHVTRCGSLPLDLKIEATEGESPYVGYLKQSTDKLGQPTKNYHGTAEDWRSLLAYGLSQEPTDAVESSLIEGLEVVTRIESGGTLTIIFRKNVEGITQRLGTITLQQDDDLEVSIFDWACQAVSDTDMARQEVSLLNAKYAQQQKVIDQLQTQLDDLVKRKEEHEETLLNKFQQLLNSKKLKIRDQQRLLASAKIDPETAAQVQQSRSSRRGRKAVPSRSSKRRAEKTAEETEHEEDGDDIDDQNNPHEADNDIGGATPDRSDMDLTEDENEDGGGFAHPLSNFPAGKPSPRDKGHASDTVAENMKPLKGPEELPPRRELPFQKRANHLMEPEEDSSKNASVIRRRVDEESTDDEL